ncbi:MAG: caspase family protein [Lewinellaceae bacterium]|nr:caspase family protein [Saprospiraceae bacterium]MCB9343033.1 caspase family protein [Lewinellaceae bacterium]
MKNIVLFILCLPSALLIAQPAYSTYTNNTGDVLYRYEDGYTITKADYDESERLGRSSRDKWRSEDYNSAFSDAVSALSKNKKNAYAWVSRGLVKSVKGDKDGAVSDYTEAIRLKPDYSLAWDLRGHIKKSKRDYDGAISDYTEAIRLAPGFSSPYYNRGEAKELKSQFEEARNDYKKALEIDPNDNLAQYYLKHLDEKLATLRPKRPPTVQLVAIGIGTYQQDHAFNHLEFTVPGAYSFRNLFERRNLTSNAKPMCESAARRRNILAALEELTDPKKVQNDDLVIFYFSGHGLMAGGKVGICPYDYQSPADLISDDDIASILTRCPARHKLCLIEACRSEKSADFIDPTDVANFNRKRRNLSPGIAFITSTEVGKKSWGGEEGYFTQAILEGLDKGLADTNGDREITVEELFNYIQPAVKKRTSNQQVPQINSGYPKDLPLMKF